MTLDTNSAIEISDEILFNWQKCRGCGHCLENCLSGCITLEPLEIASLETIVTAAIQAGADAIEIHASGIPPHELAEGLNRIKPLLHNVVPSVCIGSLQSSPTDIAMATKIISEEFQDRRVLIQCDGSTMAGTNHGLSALAAAEIVLAQGARNVFPICSGGCSALTWKLKNLVKLSIAGIGAGIASQEAFREVLEKDDLFVNPICWEYALMISKNIYAGTVKTTVRTPLGVGLQTVNQMKEVIYGN